MDSSLVIGGVGVPKFFLLQEEKNTDIFFRDISLGNVLSFLDGSVHVSHSRVLVSNSPFNDYVVRCTSHSSGVTHFAFKFYTQDSADILEEIFSSVILMAVGVAEIAATLYISSIPETIPISGGQAITIKGYPNPFYIDYEADFSSVTALYLLVVPENDSTFDVQFISNRVVSSSISFPAEQKFELNYIAEFVVKHYFLDGSFQKTFVGWRIKMQFTYEILTLSEEQWRTYLSEAEMLAIVPRIDNQYNLFCLWDGDYRREYAFNKHIGHAGILPFESVFLHSSKQVSLSYIWASPEYAALLLGEDGSLLLSEEGGFILQENAE